MPCRPGHRLRATPARLQLCWPPPSYDFLSEIISRCNPIAPSNPGKVTARKVFYWNLHHVNMCWPHVQTLTREIWFTMF